MKNKNLIILLATFTLTAFPTVGFLIAWWVNKETPTVVLELHENALLNVGIGLAVGLGTGILAWSVIQTKIMKPIQHKYSGLISSLRLNLPKIIYISICAGVGEEILFRGGLQPIMGIWLTSIVFVALHGYLNPTDWRISIYGIVMTLIIALYGWMNDYFGILSSIVAHTVIDVYLLIRLTSNGNHQSTEEVIHILPEED